LTDELRGRDALKVEPLAIGEQKDKVTSN
jgi:hypothetical protein